MSTLGMPFAAWCTCVWDMPAGVAPSLAVVDPCCWHHGLESEWHARNERFKFDEAVRKAMEKHRG